MTGGPQGGGAGLGREPGLGSRRGEGRGQGGRRPPNADLCVIMFFGSGFRTMVPSHCGVLKLSDSECGLEGIWGIARSTVKADLLILFIKLLIKSGQKQVCTFLLVCVCLCVS